MNLDILSMQKFPHTGDSKSLDQCQNKTFFGGGGVQTDVKRYGQMVGHTDRRRGGGDISHVNLSPVTC